MEPIDYQNSDRVSGAPYTSYARAQIQISSDQCGFLKSRLCQHRKPLI